MTTDQDIIDAARERYGAADIKVFSYLGADVVDRTYRPGDISWGLGDKIQWFVLSVDGDVVARRRTKSELLQFAQHRTYQRSTRGVGAR